MLRLGLIILTVVTAVFARNDSNHKRNTDRKRDAPANEFVFFSIDSVTALNYGRNAMSFYFHDSLSFGHPVAIAGKESKVLFSSPTLLFEASSRQTPFLIFPGEKIFIKYAGSDSVQMCVQGNQQRTNELDFFRRLVQHTGNIYDGFKVEPYLEKVDALKSVDSAETQISEIKKKRLQFLQAYSIRFPMSDRFVEIASNSIKSKAFNDSVQLYYNNRQLLSSLNVYKERIAEKLVTFKDLAFEPYQIYYKACINIIAVLTTNTLYAPINNDADFIKLFEFSDKKFSGIARDFLLSNILYKARTNNLQSAKNYIGRFNSLCKNEGYKRLISTKYNEAKADAYLQGHDKLLLPDGKTIQDIQWIQSKYKGKVVLLDFWASWCFPCRSELPFFDALKKEYLGKDIAFVSVSSDVTIADWLRAIKEESLENEDSFLLLNFDKSLFVKQYKIQTIPRYILVGKDGKIISEDAPRPSDRKLKELINKNL